MSNIVYKNKNIIVFNKPAGIPSQQDTTGDVHAMTLASGELRLNSEREELYLVHRLDRVVGGLLVFARNKATAATLSALAAEEKLGKEYLAVVSGALTDGSFTDYLYKNSILGKAFVSDKNKNGAKRAELDYSVLDTVRTDKGEYSLVRIILKTGRFHQIRAQFSSRGHALVGDTKYGGVDGRAMGPSLFAYKLNFSAQGETVSVRVLPNTSEYPLNLFAPEKYEV